MHSGLKRYTALHLSVPGFGNLALAGTQHYIQPTSECSLLNHLDVTSPDLWKLAF